VRLQGERLPIARKGRHSGSFFSRHVAGISEWKRGSELRPPGGTRGVVGPGAEGGCGDDEVGRVGGGVEGVAHALPVGAGGGEVETHYGFAIL